MTILDDLNNRNVFLTVLEAGNSKIKVLASLIPGKSPLPGTQMATFSRCSHMVFPWWVRVGRRVLSFFYYKVTIPVWVCTSPDELIQP